MEEEVKIISKHNLDCSSLESLANDIANRLGINIEYGQYQNENGKHNYVSLGAVEVQKNGIMSTLYDLRNNKNSDYNFVLEFGEEAKVIYNDFIELILPFDLVQFKSMERNFKINGFTNEPYYTNAFIELQKLGADKVYFIKDTFAPELAIPENTTMDDYLKIIQKETAFFEVIL
jgi:hypothetical protein